jgi:hypothetical protein
MALIPLKDTVTISKLRQLDEWGQPVYEGETTWTTMETIVQNDSWNVFKADTWDGVTNDPTVSFTYKCRINESTKIVRNQQGAEVVSTTQILIDGAVLIGYDDTVIFMDANGIERTAKPIRIGIIKDISSKPLFTEVEL